MFLFNSSSAEATLLINVIHASNDAVSAKGAYSEVVFMGRHSVVTKDPQFICHYLKAANNYLT